MSFLHFSTTSCKIEFGGAKVEFKRFPEKSILPEHVCPLLEMVTFAGARFCPKEMATFDGALVLPLAMDTFAGEHFCPLEIITFWRPFFILQKWSFLSEHLSIMSQEIITFAGARDDFQKWSRDSYQELVFAPQKWSLCLEQMSDIHYIEMALFGTTVYPQLA